MIKEQTNKISTLSKSPLGDLGVKIAIIVATLLAIASCEKEKYYYVPNYKKTDLQNGDTVYFVNNQDKSLVDTFVISVSLSMVNSDKIVNREFFTVGYTNVNKKASISEFSSWVSSSQGGVSADYVVNDTSHIYLRRSIEAFKKINIVINNKMYNSVYMITGTNTDLEMSLYDPVQYDLETLPNKIYFSYKEGILRYDYSDTNYYERKK